MWKFEFSFSIETTNLDSIEWVGVSSTPPHPKLPWLLSEWPIVWLHKRFIDSHNLFFGTGGMVVGQEPPVKACLPTHILSCYGWFKEKPFTKHMGWSGLSSLMPFQHTACFLMLDLWSMMNVCNAACLVACFGIGSGVSILVQFGPPPPPPPPPPLLLGGKVHHHNQRHQRKSQWMHCVSACSSEK